MRSPPVYGREALGTPREARQLLAGGGRSTTDWDGQRVQQRWTCSLAYRSDVEPPLPRLYTAGPVRSSCFWVASRCSFLLPSHWHPGAVRAADGLGGRAALVSLVLRYCYVLGVSHTCPPFPFTAAAAFQFGLGPRLRWHHRAILGPCSDVLAPVHGVADMTRIPEGFEIQQHHGFTVAPTATWCF